MCKSPDGIKLILSNAFFSGVLKNKWLKFSSCSVVKTEKCLKCMSFTNNGHGHYCLMLNLKGHYILVLADFGMITLNIEYFI